MNRIVIIAVHSKSVVAKVTLYLATGGHVTLCFNLQALSGHFPALGVWVVCGSRRWCVEVLCGVWKFCVVCGGCMWCVQVVGGVWKS